ncbi:MAG: BtpA/SgcQ family protein [Sulfolobales archaeon]
MLEEIFHVEKPIIGMVHLRSLPSSHDPSSIEEVLEAALKDAENLVYGGVDGLLIENFMDAPYYPRRVPRHVIALMSIIAWELRKKFKIPLGVNVLRNDSISSLAIASTVNADFIRVNVHIGCVVTDQGIIQGEAYKTLRYRAMLRSSVKIFADVSVKHGRQLYDVPLSQLARETYYRGRADALIITGAETGAEPSLKDLEIVRKAVPESPLLVGSGVKPDNIEKILAYADGAIVGTYFKLNGVVWNPVDPKRVKQLIDTVKRTRR